MKNYTLLRFSFYIGLASILVGAMLKLSHIQHAKPFLVIGILLSIVYLTMSLREIWTSIRVNKEEKIIWTIAFILMNTLTGLIYFMFGRKRVVAGEVYYD